AAPPPPASRAPPAGRPAARAPTARPSPAGRGRDLGQVRLAPAAPARRWGRSVRYGLAAAFAAVTVGGVAVAAGTGVLPLVGPAPASSVTAGETADPLVSKEPGIRQDPEAPPTDPGGDPTPGSSPSADGSTAPTPRAPDGRGPTTPAPRTPEAGSTTGSTGSGDSGSADLREKALKACRQYRTGTLDATGRRQLTRTLRGGETLRLYCDRILSGDTGTPKDDGQDGSKDSKDGSKDDSKDDGKGDQDGDGGRKGGSKGGAPGGNTGNTGTVGGIRDRAGSTLPDARLQAGVNAAPPAGITAEVRVPLGV
ncbi:hypothetical protein ACFU8I_37080, partial [Streptomyces sp. NPDC057540]|uniref:hypothetical protein n=1 Tax=Streptomyces sp. NPDC057540 TaxID=3346160 RepID=UPI0036AA31BC